MNTKIKEEASKAGLRLIHPSGAESFTKIEFLKQHKEHTRQLITLLQTQIDFLDKRIIAVESAQK